MLEPDDTENDDMICLKLSAKYYFMEPPISKNTKKDKCLEDTYNMYALFVQFICYLNLKQLNLKQL